MFSYLLVWTTKVVLWQGCIDRHQHQRDRCSREIHCPRQHFVQQGRHFVFSVSICECAPTGILVLIITQRFFRSIHRTYQVDGQSSYAKASKQTRFQFFAIGKMVFTSASTVNPALGLKMYTIDSLILSGRGDRMLRAAAETSGSRYYRVSFSSALHLAGPRLSNHLVGTQSAGQRRRRTESQLLLPRTAILGHRSRLHDDLQSAERTSK
jgi:hypothetical protein